MTPEIPPEYCMRGHRVPELSEQVVRAVAKRTCEIVRIKEASFRGRRTEGLLSRLEKYGIHVDVISDDEWIDATRATVDPQRAMIYMPEKLYSDLCRGKIEAVRIFLHELGHIVLGHKPLLHFAEVKPKEQEDSEWQADAFSDSMMDILGLEKIERQIEFKF